MGFKDYLSVQPPFGGGSRGILDKGTVGGQFKPLFVVPPFYTHLVGGSILLTLFFVGAFAQSPMLGGYYFMGVLSSSVLSFLAIRYIVLHHLYIQSGILHWGYPSHIYKWGDFLSLSKTIHKCSLLEITAVGAGSLKNLPKNTSLNSLGELRHDLLGMSHRGGFSAYTQHSCATLLFKDGSTKIMYLGAYNPKYITTLLEYLRKCGVLVVN